MTKAVSESRRLGSLKKPQLRPAGMRALQSDPAFQEVLSDPEITRALAAGDLFALLANPKINALGTNPTVQEITKKLGE